MDKMIDLCYDAFGNYFIQKVIENLSDKHIDDVLNIVMAILIVDFWLFSKPRYSCSRYQSYPESYRKGCK